MYLPFIFSFVLLVGAGSALPTLEARTCRSFVDTFDDLQTSVGNTVPVGTYHGVTYQGFTVGTKSAVTGSSGGIVPHSGKNDALNGLRNTVTQVGAISLVPFGNIVAAPSKAFDLKSFWFGCGTNAQQSVASTSTACTISLTGFNTAGVQIGVATFSFAPKNLLAAPMNLATVPSRFSSLKNVTIGLSSTVTDPAAALLHLDDVTHCNYY